jgi:predicted ester cyclase
VTDLGHGKDHVRRYLEDVFSNGNVAAVDKYLSGDRFIEGVIDLVNRWRTAFSDFQLTVDTAIAEDDRVVTVEVLTGTHDGIYQSRIGPVSPTGRTVKWSRIAIRALRDGRFVEGFWKRTISGSCSSSGFLRIRPARPIRTIASGR